MRVCLLKKFAEAIDGVDLSGRQVGDVLELDASEARLLIAEEWAVPERRSRERECAPTLTTAARASSPSTPRAH